MLLQVIIAITEPFVSDTEPTNCKVVPEMYISAHTSTLIKPCYIRVSGSSESVMLTQFQPWCVYTRDETILQYIDILQHLLQQYNTIRLNENIIILHTAIYCDILQYIGMSIVLML